MSLTPVQAHNEMCSQFKAVWDAQSIAVTPGGYIPQVLWKNVQERSEPDKTKYWVRFSVINFEEEQRTISADVQEPGKNRFEAIGLVVVQLFCPKSQVDANQVGLKLAAIAKSAFRGKKTPGGVAFKRASIKDVDPEDTYYRFNIVTEFEYDEIA